MFEILFGVWGLFNLIAWHFVGWLQVKHDIEGSDGVKFVWKVVLISWIIGKLGGIVQGILNGIRGWALISGTALMWPLMMGTIVLFISFNFRKNKKHWQHEWEDGLAEGMVYYGILESGRLLAANINKGQMIYWLVVFVVYLIVLIWMKNRYKRIKLYKSGKTGFVFWTSWIVVSLMSLIAGIVWWGNIYLGLTNLIISLVMLVVAIVGWYKRAGRRVSEDWPWLYYWFK